MLSFAWTSLSRRFVLRWYATIGRSCQRILSVGSFSKMFQCLRRMFAKYFVLYGVEKIGRFKAFWFWFLLSKSVWMCCRALLKLVVIVSWSYPR